MKARQPARAKRRNYRVFIVEDDANLTAHLSDVLRLEGCAVVTAVDGLHALQFLTEGFRPDVILLDMHMDGADGWDFFTSLGQLQLKVPVVVMTGDPDAAKCAEDVGAVSYLKKPFETDQFLHVLDEAVRPRRRETGAGA